MAQLAQDIGLSHGMVWRYASGNAHPTLETMDKLTDALNCDVEDIVRFMHDSSVDDKIKRYEEELRSRFTSVPSELDDFIKKMVEAYRKGLEE